MQQSIDKCTRTMNGCLFECQGGFGLRGSAKMSRRPPCGVGAADALAWAGLSLARRRWIRKRVAGPTRRRTTLMSPRRKQSCQRGAIEGGSLSGQPPLIGADNGTRTSDISSQEETGKIQARVTEEDYENQQNQKKVKKEHRFGVLYITPLLCRISKGNRR